MLQRLWIAGAMGTIFRKASARWPNVAVAVELWSDGHVSGSAVEYCNTSWTARYRRFSNGFLALGIKPLIILIPCISLAG